jgi:hypothetical protein
MMFLGHRSAQEERRDGFEAGKRGKLVNDVSFLYKMSWQHKWADTHHFSAHSRVKAWRIGNMLFVYQASIIALELHPPLPKLCHLRDQAPPLPINPEG